MASEVNSNSIENSGITVTISTDKAEYRAGEAVEYSITVENGTKHENILPTALTYDNSEGLIAAGEGSMPDSLPEIGPGESYTLSGTLTGDSQIFPVMESSSKAGLWIAVLAGVMILAVAAVIMLVTKGQAAKNQTTKNQTTKKRTAKKQTAKNQKAKKQPAKGQPEQRVSVKKKKGVHTEALFLAAALTGAGIAGLVGAAFSLSAQAEEEQKKVSASPYVTFRYAGQEVRIGVVMEMGMEWAQMVIDEADKREYQWITCHDPSIFKDFDGTYYIIGSFLAGGSTQNLYDWISLDTEFQGNFTEDVKAQIRGWNDDDAAETWNGYLWAPDIIYNPTMKKYCVYLSANGDNWKSNIVLLTADAVTGPYEYGGTVVYGGFNAETYGETDAPQVLGESEIPQRYVTYGVNNKKWGDMYPNCIDPCVFYDDDGNLWISYGSWSGGIFMLELDEKTGLRDYTVSYETAQHSDAYFGTKIAGGKYVSGEASYIQKIGDYYYLFVSYGNLEAAGGYNIRVFRSQQPDGEYMDMLGNSTFSDSYVFNYNMSKGVRLMGGYKWRNFQVGQVAQGHNSAFVDDDGKAYMVFHTRTDNGTEYHYVKVHQLFTTKEGWLVAAPYQTTGETMQKEGYSAAEVAGEYELIMHELAIDFRHLETKQPQFITLAEDGKITGDYEGTWELTAGTPYILLNIGGKDYSGVTVSMQIEYTSVETMTFTAVGLTDQVTIWGSRMVD